MTYIFHFSSILVNNNNNKYTFVSPFLQGLKGAKHEYKSQNQTLYATANKYCFKSVFIWSTLKLMSLTVIGSEFQTLESEDQKLRGPKR